MKTEKGQDEETKVIGGKRRKLLKRKLKKGEKKAYERRKRIKKRKE